MKLSWWVFGAGAAAFIVGIALWAMGHYDVGFPLAFFSVVPMSVAAGAVVRARRARRAAAAGADPHGDTVFGITFRDDAKNAGPSDPS